MEYSDFTTIAKVKALGLDFVEVKFLPKITPIEPSAYLQEALRLGLLVILARRSETDRAYNA